MKFNGKLSLLLVSILFIGSTARISMGTANTGISSEVISLLESNSFVFDIKNGSGDVYFYPAGNVAIETNGKINLTFTGKYDEWGIPDLFFDIEFIQANGAINSTIKNISQSTIGMNLVWGFGGFAPDFVCSTNWTANDNEARLVADAPASDFWPSLSGTLDIENQAGYHSYNYTQNPANGTQKVFLAYRESTGILEEFISSFGNYYLDAKLSVPNFYESNQLLNLEQSIISYQILSPTGEVYFYPLGNVALEQNGFINLTYTGEYFEYGMLNIFFDIDFIYANGTVNSTIKNISQSSIGMSLIWGFGGFNPNFLPLNSWDSLDQKAHDVADAPASEFWPSLNGTLSIDDTQEYHSYTFSQNPANGTQSTFLKYHKNTTILTEFHSSFESYNLHAILVSLQDNSSDYDIPSYPIIFFFASISVIILLHKIHPRILFKKTL